MATRKSSTKPQVPSRKTESSFDPADLKMVATHVEVIESICEILISDTRSDDMAINEGHKALYRLLAEHAEPVAEYANNNLGNSAADREAAHCANSLEALAKAMAVFPEKESVLRWNLDSIIERFTISLLGWLELQQADERAAA